MFHFDRGLVVETWPERKNRPSHRVQFSRHFSVQEFLTSDHLATTTMDDLRYHHIRLEPAYMIIPQACLGVLLLRLDNNVDGDGQTIESYPLARHADQRFGGQWSLRTCYYMLPMVSTHSLTRINYIFNRGSGYRSAYWYPSTCPTFFS